MNLKRYIKVTPYGEKRSIILLATNRDFYLSQKAQVEQPTEEEVLAAFPELGAKRQTEPTTSEKDERIAALEQEVAALREENKRLTSTKTVRKTTKDE